MKNQRRSRRTREEWQQLIQAKQKSVLSQAVCTQRSISQKRFGHWIRRPLKARKVSVPLLEVFLQ